MLPDYHLLLPHQHLHPPSHHCYIRSLSKTLPFPLSIILPDTLVHRRVHDHIQTQRCTGERGPAEAVRLTPTVCLKSRQTPAGPSYTPAAAAAAHRSTFTLLPHPAATSHIHTISLKPTHHHDIPSSSLTATGWMYECGVLNTMH